MALNGITRLVAVTQMKAESANTQVTVQAAKQTGTRQALHEALFTVSNQGMIGNIKSRFETAAKDLESQDKLGNFQIQGLMSDFNQAETLASSLTRKKDDSTIFKP